MPLLHAPDVLGYCGDRSVPHAIYFVISKKLTEWQIKARDNIQVAETASELLGILSLLEYKFQLERLNLHFICFFAFKFATILLVSRLYNDAVPIAEI
jgi:hypothetical protein